MSPTLNQAEAETIDPTRDYLMRAYMQEHPTSKEDWIADVEQLVGAGELLELHKYMCNKYGVPCLGTSRVTYLSTRVVFKVPINDRGFRGNDWEASLMSIGKEGDKYYIPLARSRFLPKCEIPVVVMERVEEASLNNIEGRLGYIPDFVSAVDMGQVGWTRKGKLVAFDYADL